MISLFTKHLPYKVSQQITIEYDIRLNEIRYLTSEKFESFHFLRKNMRTVELLLAMSIFYKRIICNFESANKFTSRVILNSDAKSIKIGTYDFNSKEIFKLKRTIIEFDKILIEYQINPALFDYTETIVFLRKIRHYKQYLDNQKRVDGESF